MPRMHALPAVLAAVFLAGLITLAAPAQAIVVETPLVREPYNGSPESDVTEEAPEARDAPGIGLAVLLASLGALVASRRR